MTENQEEEEEASDDDEDQGIDFGSENA